MQSLHWNNGQYSIHPVVMYYRDNETNKLKEQSFGFVSAELKHDAVFVNEVIKKVCKHIKTSYPNIKHLKYFSDGCAGQCKNFKNSMNLCCHKHDFGLDPTSNFFATSHGKSAVDGVGATTKRITVRASLQRPFNDQILAAKAVYNFCCNTIESVIFNFIHKHELTYLRENLGKRYVTGDTIPAIRRYHQFCVLPSDKIAYKRMNNDDEFTGTFTFSDAPIPHVSMEEISPNEYIACYYGNNWWIGKINEEERDVKSNFMHPPGSSRSLTWPE